MKTLLSRLDFIGKWWEDAVRIINKHIKLIIFAGSNLFLSSSFLHCCVLRQASCYSSSWTHVGGVLCDFQHPLINATFSCTCSVNGNLQTITAKWMTATDIHPFDRFLPELTWLTASGFKASKLQTSQKYLSTKDKNTSLHTAQVVQNHGYVKVRTVLTVILVVELQVTRRPNGQLRFKSSCGICIMRGLGLLDIFKETWRSSQPCFFFSCACCNKTLRSLLEMPARNVQTTMFSWPWLSVCCS